MLRNAKQTDVEQLAGLRAAACRETPQQAAAWVREIVGIQNIFLLENTPPRIDALLAMVPVYSGARRGVWFAGLYTQPAFAGSAVLPRLVDAALRACAARGYDFAVTVPRGDAQRAMFGTVGFGDALPLRVVRRTITQNLWAQADFDTMTVRRLQEERQRFAPGSIVFPEPVMAGILHELYSRGLTLVSGPRGYGLFYQTPDKLYFAELQADNDHSADLLLQASARHTGVFEARLLLSESQSLYLGQGKRSLYAMLCTLRQPLAAGELYFRPLL